MVNEQPRPLASVPDEAVERRNHWFRLAVELGQQDDFTALLATEHRSALAEVATVVGAIETGAGSDHYRHGRDTMRHDALMAIDMLGPGVER